MKVLLAHTPEMRRNYYGDRSLSGLRAIAEVILHEGDQALDAAGLVRAAAEADIIVAAAGVPHMVTAEMVRPGAAVVDVGVSRDDDDAAVPGSEGFDVEVPERRPWRPSQPRAFARAGLPRRPRGRRGGHPAHQ